jgi:hypothetical protein
MFFSAKLIEELVIELAQLSKLNTDSLHNLIYHLKLPGDTIPKAIAQVIAARPGMSLQSTYFSARLAYGILDDCLLLYDEHHRYQQQAKLCRQVNRIRLGLEELEHPVKVIDSFEERLSLLVFATASANDLAVPERTLSNAELAILVEQLLHAMLIQAEITKLLMERIISRLSLADKNCLALRVGNAIREGLRNEPWDDTLTPDTLCSLTEPVRFRLSLCKDPAFGEAAWDTLEHFNSLSRH